MVCISAQRISDILPIELRNPNGMVENVNNITQLCDHLIDRRHNLIDNCITKNMKVAQR